MKGVRIFRIVIWCLVAVVATGLFILGRDLNVRPGDVADTSNASSPPSASHFASFRIRARQSITVSWMANRIWHSSVSRTARTSAPRRSSS